MRRYVLIILALLVFMPVAVAGSTADQTFRDLEDRISKAVIAKDAAEMNKLLATDYLSVGFSGQVR